MNSYEAEEATHILLQRCNPLDVIVSQIERFRRVHKHAPAVCVVSSHCHADILRALVQQLDWPPEAAVGEPIYMNAVPVLFQKLPAGVYLICKSSAAEEPL